MPRRYVYKKDKLSRQFIERMALRRGLVEKKNRYLYILKCKEYYKIGFATNFEERFNTLQTGNPFLIEIHLKVPLKNPARLEQELHAMFNSKRHFREWFSLDKEDLNAINELLKTWPKD